MKSIKKIGLVALLTAGLGLTSITGADAEHKGRLKRHMNEDGYKIVLEDYNKELKAIINYFDFSKDIYLVFFIKDELSSITPYAELKGNIKNKIIVDSLHALPYLVPSFNSRAMRRDSNTEVLERVWNIYMDALHQPETHQEWLKKYGD